MPKARVFTSGTSHLARVECIHFTLDPSLRLKNGYARDDAA